jgi:hypothetical protein
MSPLKFTPVALGVLEEGGIGARHAAGRGADHLELAHVAEVDGVPSGSVLAPQEEPAG